MTAATAEKKDILSTIKKSAGRFTNINRKN